MPAAYHTLMQSGLDHIFVGKSRKQFSIHKALRSSFPKRALEPKMIKAVDEEVFGRCCEFVYSGDYSVPPPITKSSKNDDLQGRDIETRTQKVAKRWDPSHLTWNIFSPKGLSQNYDRLLQKLDHPPRSKFVRELNNDPFTSYAAVFLSHAEIYCFGIKTGWRSLAALSAYRLLRLLEDFTLFEERTEDIVQLLEFVFEDSEHMIDLETLLREYIIWNVEMMMRNVDFRDFLERNPMLEQTVFRAMWE
ncbi:uncharacterized protein N7484_008160 [Penicillium longicatenatum]|uniref:uncharacterized protein n=1 Tax=Penicillium longicatenatum TaxID=1561947 RepID=UPI002549047A|nr:uncharacterized protein N7484_008160 [Penicillium longicatenatum]KAJ5640298.1 hypothetical protein N7484_008160 [Penicillium longicatenatum]